MTHPLARPGQSLISHLRNVDTEIMKVLERVPVHYGALVDEIGKEDMKRTIRLILRVISYTHDFGKISSFFQKRVQGGQDRTGDKALSHHVEVSVLLAYLSVREFLASSVSPSLADELGVAGSICIMNHHFSQLEDQIEQVFSGESLDRIVTILSDISEQQVNVDAYTVCLPEVIRNSIVSSLKGLLTMDRDGIQDLIDRLAESRDRLPRSVRLFLLTEFFYSCLCDADEFDAKFHLEDTNRHYFTSDEKRTKFDTQLVDSYRQQCVEDGTWNLSSVPAELIRLRENTYSLTKELAQSVPENGVATLSAPTGSGKTLALLGFALDARSRIETLRGYSPKIIYALPFVSIADQVGHQIALVLGKEDDSLQDPQLTVHHHLVEPKWSTLQPEVPEPSTEGLARFFINLWRSDFIVTSFVKLWDSILSGRKRELLRLNRIAGSILLLDEVQSLPVKYWDLLGNVLTTLAEDYGCIVLLSTATLPQLWEPARVRNAKVSLSDYHISRYRIHYDPEDKSLDDFHTELTSYLETHPKEHTMVVLNTKRAAYLTYSRLSAEIGLAKGSMLFYMSGLVTPHDRRKTLELVLAELKRKDVRCILVCTQLIEAGVDISFDTVFRDFAPLDSIIQVAGRCNRHSEHATERPVFVRHLLDDNKSCALMAYQDPVSLDTTRRVLEGHKLISERVVSNLCDRFYELLRERKRTSECIDVVEQLRFRSLSDQFTLIEEIENAITIFVRDDRSQSTLLKLQRAVSAAQGPIVIPSEFHQFVIHPTVTQIHDMNILTPFEANGEVLFYVLDTERYADCYSPSSGYRLLNST